MGSEALSRLLNMSGYDFQRRRRWKVIMDDKKCSCCGYVFNGEKIEIMKMPMLEVCHCGFNYASHFAVPFNFEKARKM